MDGILTEFDEERYRKSLLEDGMLMGIAKGRLETLISQVCKKLAKGCSPAEIAEILEESPDTIQTICDAAASCAPEYDVERIYSILHPEL